MTEDGKQGCVAMSKLLIVADPDERCHATPRGLELAARLNLEAEVVAFVHAPLKALDVSAAQQAKIQKLLLREREKVVRARIARHRQRGQKVQLRVEWSKDVLRCINRRCAGGRYYAVVKTGNGDGARVGTPADWELLRQCRAPVLLVAEKKWHHTRPVLVALDLASRSPRKRALNKRVLEAGQALGRSLGVPLEIVAAIEVPVLLSDLDLIDTGSYVSDAKAAMQPQIRRLSAAMGIPESAFVAKRGPAHKVITSQAAKRRAQIVVVGTVGRTGVKARLLGNTAEKVLAHLHTDVLAIRP